jgi:hypothetical protein
VGDQHSAVRHRVGGIAHQVDKHLRELIAIADDGGEVRVEHSLNLDPALEAHLEEIERALYGLVQ